MAVPGYRGRESNNTASLDLPVTGLFLKPVMAVEQALASTVYIPITRHEIVASIFRAAAYC